MWIKHFLRALILFLLLCILLFPLTLFDFGVIDLFAAPEDFLFLTHRIFGMYAISLVFVQIVLGSARDVISKLFPPVKVLKWHMASGKITFTAIFAHITMLLLTPFFTQDLSYITPYFEKESLIYLLAGIAAFTFLCIAVLAAVFRAKIGPKWVYLHRINYLVFFTAVIHALNLGIDVHEQTSLVLTLYGAVAALLFGRKLFNWVIAGKLKVKN